MASSMDHLGPIMRFACAHNGKGVKQATAFATSQGNPEGRWLVAHALALAIAEQTGLEQFRNPNSISLSTNVPHIRDTCIFGQGGQAEHGERKAAAWRFIDAYLDDDHDQQMQVTDTDGDTVIYGLAELLTSTCPSKVHGHG